MLNLSMQQLQESSLFNAGNAPYLEELYDSFLKNPDSVPENWRRVFEESLQLQNPMNEPIHAEIQSQLRHWTNHPEFFTQNAAKDSGGDSAGDSAPAAISATITPTSTISTAKDLLHERKQTQVFGLIEAYRLLGHLHANIDPLQMRQKPIVPELMLSYYHLSEADLPTLFSAGSLPGPKMRSLKQIIEDLKSIYCGTIASEFLHIPDSPERVWVQERVERLVDENPLTNEIKKYLFMRITVAEGLEKYLGAKFPGVKRFSLEGNDTLIIVLNELIQQGGSLGIKEMVIGMAHRGRLNVLMNILGKDPRQVLDEFEGKLQSNTLSSGDVKYHQGFSSDLITSGGPVHVSLAFNPSHLEIVAPVVCGSVRARQERSHDKERRKVLSIILHGDASIAGQGVVMETFNMSKTHANAIGGSVHIIVNNQIGFTTSNPRDARSTLYCSDIGKMLEIPIFHVNADDPEAVYHVTHLALDYRNKFKKDVIIDLIGYRRHGHNEADEPSVTQPIMYKIIHNLPTVREIYGKKIIDEQIYSQQETEALENQYREMLDKRQMSLAQNLIPNHAPTQYSSDWKQYFNSDWRIKVQTGVPVSVIQGLAQRLEIIPKGFVLHSRIKKLFEERQKMTRGEIPMDWGYGETIAYATLINEGVPVRLVGQDSCRGTFFHRQAVLHDQNTGECYTPLTHVSESQARFSVYDSLLSEEAALGFEYGYATTDPHKLVIWEAQFGDFANNAQVVIDQFISSGEQKWGRLCGLTLYLPHSYEGQGPEHSSARLERYLQLCAEHNMQVCVPTTPAQLFHMLRRQMLRPLRKPLIVLTPKSLLRHKLAVSSLLDLEKGEFMTIIPEIDNIPPEQVTRLIFCSGKVYYDLLEARRTKKLNHIAILRIEQLYPFPEDELKAAIKFYKKATQFVWCQEEPQNQGAWYSSHHHLQNSIGKDRELRYAGRAPAAAPSVGHHDLHIMQQKALVVEALEG